MCFCVIFTRESDTGLRKVLYIILEFLQNLNIPDNWDVLIISLSIFVLFMGYPGDISMVGIIFNDSHLKDGTKLLYQVRCDLGFLIFISSWKSSILWPWHYRHWNIIAKWWQEMGQWYWIWLVIRWVEYREERRHKIGVLGRRCGTPR